MTIHNKACVLAYEHYQKELADWLAKWEATYCRECNARGEWTDTFDPSPAGVGLSAGWMEDGGPCASCTLCDADHPNPLCPRCMSPWSVIYDDNDDPICLLAAQELPCPRCGWNWGKNLDDTLPVEPECFCDDGPDTEGLEAIPAFLILDELPPFLEGSL